MPAPGFGLESVLKPLGQAVWILGSVGLVLLLVAVMLFQKEDLRDRLIRLAGRTNLYATTRALDEASAKVSRYLLSTSLVNGSLAVCVGAGLFLIGVPNAVLFGPPLRDPAVHPLHRAAARRRAAGHPRASRSPRLGRCR